MVTLSAAVGAQAQQTQYSAGGLQGFGYKCYRESAASKAPLAKISYKDIFAVGLRTDGTLIQWGTNQVGMGTEIPMGTTRAIDIAAGYYHALYQKADGTLGAWGFNFYGQTNVPASLGKVIDFDAGMYFSVAVKENGTVAAWGVTGAPTTVPSGLSNVVQVAAGQSHTVALKSDGTVVCWGGNTSGQTTVPSDLANVVQVDAGANTSAALKSDGTVVVWGYTGDGQGNIPAGLSGVTKVVVGSRNVAALKSDGTVTVWGSSIYQTTNVPSGLSGVVDIELGGYCGQALKADGTQIGWGNFDFYPPNVEPLIDVCGNAASTNPRYWVGLTAAGKPVVFGSAISSIIAVPSGLTGVQKVAVGSNVVVAIKADGKLTAWGSGAPLLVPSITNVVDIAVGATHGLAVTSSGAVSAWGTNTYGQTTVPATATDVIQVAAGEGHSVALKSDGTVLCWGLNDQGQSTVPSGLTGVVKIAAGDRHTIAVKNDGTVVAWGSNVYSENTPPSGLSDAVNAASGIGSYLALRSNGMVAKWGMTAAGTNYTLNGVSGIVKVTAADGSYCLPNVYLSPSASTVSGTKTTTATVTLPIAPGVGGADVTIATNSVGTSAPGTVHVNEGAHTATFTIYSESVTANKVVFISATYQGNTVWAAVTVTPRADILSEVEVLPMSVVGGSTTTVTGRVKLGAAATEDITVPLTVDDPSLVTVPTSVVVPLGATEATFPVSHNPTATAKMVTISGTFGKTFSAILSLTSGSTSGLTLSSPSVSGGTSVTGRVSVNTAFATNITVSLSSDNSAASVPDSVVIPAGSTYADFTITTAPRATDTVATIYASYAESTSSAALTVLAPRLASISAPASMYGLQLRAGTLTLDAPAPADYTVNLVSSSGVITVAPVTFSTGSKNGYFSLTSSDPSSTANVTLTASLSGVVKTAVVTVTPNTIRTLTLSRPSVLAGSTTPVTATLRLVAPPDFPTVAALAASDSEGSLSVPATVSISTTGEATFTVSHKMVGDYEAGLITAKRLGKTVATSIALNPNTFTLRLSQSSVYGGSTTELTGKVTLASAVSQDTYLQLSSDRSAAASVPATVLIPAGQKVGTFTITHEDVAETLAVNIAVKKGPTAVVSTPTVKPITVVSHTVSPATVPGGSTEILAVVTLKAAPRQDMVVDLTSSAPTVASVPATVTVHAGEQIATYHPTVMTVTKTKSAALKATRHGVGKGCVLTVSFP